MFSPITFLKETRTELDQVKWPLRRDVIKLTVLVITVSVIVGLYIGGLDFLFTKAFELFVSNRG